MDNGKIAQIVQLIREQCRPKKIILFGSQARGSGTPFSDIDIMIIVEKLADRRKEMVDVGRLLAPLKIKADVLIVTEKNFNDWRDTPGNIYFETAREGRVLYDDKAA